MKGIVRRTRVLLAVTFLAAPLARGGEFSAEPLPSEGGGSERIEELRSLSLEALLDQDVSSVSRRRESLLEAAAAAYVISNDDIKRSGARNIPEALRMAPGLSVGQIDANTWAVTARGFNDRYSDKLLVMIDGRTVYTSITSGVNWEAQQYLLEDIERIEVVRGPGGTLWGTNAVNGVINIITKPSNKTSSGLVTGGLGNQNRAFAGLRYGTPLGDDTHLRFYTNFVDYNDQAHGYDAWDHLQGGFRMDWMGPNSEATLQGDIYRGNVRQEQVIRRFEPVPGIEPPSYLEVYPEEYRIEGGNVLFRFNHEWSEESDMQFQFYYDHVENGQLAFQSEVDTIDFDFQHRFSLPWEQEMLWGVGYRWISDLVRPSAAIAYYDPPKRQRDLFSMFLQDRISLLDDRLRITLGAKFEHNDFTGWEFQPNVRFAWRPDDRQTLWGAVSRAVQLPGRNIHDIRHNQNTIEPTIIDGLPLFVDGNGNEDAQAQELLAFELGYRVQPNDTFSFDIATFFNQYDHFISGNIGTPSFQAEPVPHLQLPVTTDAEGRGEVESYGVEVAAQWQATEDLKLRGHYSFIRMDLDGIESSIGTEDKDPRHQFSLQASLDLPGDVYLDVWGRYVDPIGEFHIGSYFDLDVRLAWQYDEQLEFAIVGQNLLEPSRAEFEGSEFTATVPSEVRRSVHFQVTYDF